MKYIFTILMLLAMFGCQEHAEVIPAVSDNITLQINKIELQNLSDLALDASLNTTSDKILDYGFIVSEFPEPTLQRGKVVKVGAAKTTTNFSHTYVNLDTGNTYNVRAYAQWQDKVVYSAVKTSVKVAPAITSISHTISNFASVFFTTNLQNFKTNAETTVYFDEQPLKLKATYPVREGNIYEAELPADFQPGEYTASIKIGNLKLTYPKSKITVLPGRWVRITDLPFNDMYFTTTFVKDDWVYVLQNKSGKTEFFKQNYKTHQKVALTPNAPKWFPYSPAIAVVQSKVHFIGGEEYTELYTSQTTSAHYIYDLSNDQWSREKDFPGDARLNPVSGVFANKIYFGLGYDLPPKYTMGGLRLKNDLWEYNLQTKTWTRLANFPQTGRMGNASFMVGPQLHVVGGYERYRTNKENWCYNVLTNKWTRKADYPGQGFTAFAGFAVENYGYVGLGEVGVYSSMNDRSLYPTFFRYNPQADRWNRVSDFNGNVPIDKHTTSQANLGFLIGPESLYSSSFLAVYSFKP
ncbi:MAG: Kelch repeat-containing protein [Adhaeribacter sp.]